MIHPMRITFGFLVFLGPWLSPLVLPFNGSAGKFDSRKETISMANVSGLSTADDTTAVLEAVNHIMMVVMASMIHQNIYGVLLDL